MTRNLLNRKVIGCIAAIIFLTMTGCHVSNPYEPTPPDESAKALEELKTLPSLEDTKIQLHNTIESIKASVEVLIPKINWRELDKEEKAGCANLKPYDQSDGQSVYLPDTVAAGVSVSEGNWALILQAAKEAAAKLGIADVQVFQDSPSKHDVALYGPGGIFIKVRYAGNLVVSGYTGCRLPAAKR